jgi:hypothetical protein
MNQYQKLTMFLAIVDSLQNESPVTPASWRARAGTLKAYAPEHYALG